MKLALVVAAALALLAGTAAQARDCDLESRAALKSSETTVAALAKPLGYFSGALNRTLEHFVIRNSVAVVVVDCPYHGEDVLTRNILDIPNAGMMYGVYLDASYLKYAAARELERRATLEACRIHQGSLDALDPGDQRYAQLRAQHCMAEIVGDTELIKWLDRVTPTREQRAAEIYRQNKQSLRELQEYLFK